MRTVVQIQIRVERRRKFFFVKIVSGFDFSLERMKLLKKNTCVHVTWEFVYINRITL